MIGEKEVLIQADLFHRENNDESYSAVNTLMDVYTIVQVTREFVLQKKREKREKGRERKRLCEMVSSFNPVLYRWNLVKLLALMTRLLCPLSTLSF